MSVFNPEENTIVCMYGPPPDFTTPDTPAADPEAPGEEDGFLSKLFSLIRKLFDMIKGLFVRD